MPNSSAINGTTQLLLSDEPTVFSVSQLNHALKKNIERDFPLIWLKGELSNFTAHRSGHLYFSLKDDAAQMSAVMFKGSAAHLSFSPKVGDEVIVRCRVTVYVPRGNTQVVVEKMEPMGAGAMQRRFEELKKKLHAEGLFDASRKKPLPRSPKKVVLITSPTGAAIRDILNILSRRGRGLEIVLIPAVVQGTMAPASLIQAMESLQRMKNVDVAVIGRGGGSIEDLWAFNDEALARAIAACPVPIVSAVGHEVDFTIADFVADLRAPTPSAAAELIVKDAAEILLHLNRLDSALKSFIGQTLKNCRRELMHGQSRLASPQRKIQDYFLRTDDYSLRMQNAFASQMRMRKQKLASLTQGLRSPSQWIIQSRQRLKTARDLLIRDLQKGLAALRDRCSRQVAVLDSLSPLKVVGRGYGLVTLLDSGELIKDVKQLNVDDHVKVHFAIGSAEMKMMKTIDRGEK